jgi:transposase
VEACAARLSVLVKAMAKDALNAHCIAMDATGVLVQDKEKCRRGHFWVLVADRDHVLFRYTSKHNREGPKAFLRGYKGYVQADAASVYNELFRSERVTEVGCWAHCRRGFFEAMISDPARARVALGFIQRLYAVDAETRELPPQQRTAQRRLRDVLILLPGWSRDRVLELSPKRWKQTSSRPMLGNGSRRRRGAVRRWGRRGAEGGMSATGAGVSERRGG